MSNYVQIGKLIDSISKTHKFDKNELIFLNTSDVLEGKILINHYTPVSELKGQAKKTIQNGDILYSEIRPRNRRYAFVKNLTNPEDYVVSTKLMVLRNSSARLDTNYLFYFLTSEDSINYLQRKAENRIGSFPQITFDVLSKLQIRLPELSTQQKIAKVLSDLDAKIELNNKINAELEAMAKTLYDYWFVQFDFPDANGKPYKSSGGKMVWNADLKREIPEGWDVKELGELIRPLESGKRPKGGIDKELKNGIPSLGAESIDKLGYFNYKSTKYIPFSYKERITSGVIQNNDILIYKDGAYVGKTTLFRDNFPFEFATINEHVFLLRSSKSYFQEYLFFTLKLESYYNLMQSLGQKAAQPGLNQNDLKSLNIIEPNHDIVMKYQQIIEPFFARIFNNSKENQELASLRDWLLPMLMNGQVSVASTNSATENGYEVEDSELGMVAESGEKYNK